MVLCILVESSPSECEADDAKSVLDLLGRMESSFIFSGFCLIRVIKQRDSRFITWESNLFAIVWNFLHISILILLSICCFILETHQLKPVCINIPQRPQATPCYNSKSVSFFCYAITAVVISVNTLRLSSTLCLQNAPKIYLSIFKHINQWKNLFHNFITL